MSDKVKDISIKNHTYYFFNNVINIKNFDPNNIKIDEKSNKNIFVYYIGHVTIKDSKYVKIDSVNPLNLIINKVNWYFEINKNEYLILVSTNENKEKIKKCEELWNKIRDLIRSMTKNSDDYVEKYIKIKFNVNDKLPLNKMIKIPTMIIAVRVVFHGNNKCY